MPIERIDALRILAKKARSEEITVLSDRGRQKGGNITY